MIHPASGTNHALVGHREHPQPGRFHLFAVNISQVTFIAYDPSGSGDQHVAIWPPGREFVRRGTSATSVGAPEPVSDIIQPG